MKKSLDNFTNDQLSRWPLARDNYRALKNAEVRAIRAGGLDVKLQYNPARIVSTAAKVDAASISVRKCFLCRENRPEDQISLKFDGRKGKKYDILVNPYPIFNGHFVIAMDRHCPQSIWNRYVDMLDLAKAYQKHVFMYNGPECGASAPDHHHFQAAGRGLLPLEKDVDALLDATDGQTPVPDAVKDCSGEKGGTLEYLASVKEARLYHYRKFTRGIFVLRARTAKSMAKLFYRLLDCVPVKDGDNEPRFNLIVWYGGGEYRSAVMFRDRHRPSHYYSAEPGHLLLSPGCADMAGFFVVPRKEDFEKITPAILEEVLSEVSMSSADEHLAIWRLTRTQPLLSVGIMAAEEIVFEILSDGAGVRKAVWRDGKIEYDGALYDELYFEAQTLSTMFAGPDFILHDVVIGAGFHWERKETQKFAGALKIVVEGKCLRAINVIGVEDYLLSVISSEMKSTSSEEFLKAHAVISRSWVMSRIMPGTHDVPARPVSISPDEVVKWYGHEDHNGFDVCADDHCQRYQGLTRAAGETVRKAIDSTWGEVLAYDGRLCDARFSKCCGGMTETFSTCWDDVDYPYLQPVPDTAQGCLSGLDLSGEHDARLWIEEPSVAESSFCNTSDPGVLSQVLNDYDRESPDFFRWKVSYGRDELSGLVRERTGQDIGGILALHPLHRGPSGRLDRLEIVGTKKTIVIGKELEIRRVLSHSHLKSSAFVVDYYDRDGRPVALDGNGSPAAGFETVVLRGAGWGHGVGLCQIGAAMMAFRGYGYRDILAHYYTGAVVSRLDQQLA